MSAESVFRRITGEPPRDDRERLEWAIDDHTVAVIAATQGREGPFGAQLAVAKTKLLAAVDDYVRNSRLEAGGAVTDAAAVAELVRRHIRGYAATVDSSLLGRAQSAETGPAHPTGTPAVAETDSAELAAEIVAAVNARADAAG